MNWLVIVVMIFLLLKAVFGYRKGFAKKLLSMVALILTIFLVWILAPHVSEFLTNRTPLKTNIASGMEQGILENLESSTGDNSAKLENLPVPQSIIDGMKSDKVLDDYMEMGLLRLSQGVSEYMADLVVGAVAYVGTFLIVFILIQILIHLIDAVAHIPILKQVNEIMGLVLGVVEGLIFIWLGCLVITMFSGNTQWGIACLQLIRESPILDWIYNNNFLVRIVLQMIGSM